MTGQGKRGWRYQPVWIQEEGDERVYGLCEIWLDEQDRLTEWTEGPFMVPQGTSPEEVTKDLVRMLTDAYCYVPVAFTTLRVGVTFQHAIGPGKREALARMVEATSQNFKAAN